jgi:hypothetical protein
MAWSNAHAGRWVRTVRAGCLDWTLIWNRHHLQRVHTAYLGHTTQPDPTAASTSRFRSLGGHRPCIDPAARIERIDVLGGLIREYRRAA